MHPITVIFTGTTPETPAAICQAFLATERWPEFTGYGPLPGIRHAAFVERTPTLVGSRIAVQNTDGSHHTETIIGWEAERRIHVRFSDFSPPLDRLASHFIETWELRPRGPRTEITRSMTLYPTHWLGWLGLALIAPLLKQALMQQAAKAAQQAGG